MARIASALRLLVPIIGLVLALGACQPRGKTEDPVFGSVRNDRVSAVKDWLAKGGDPNLKNRDGDTLLYVASGPKGGIGVASTLIAAGADVNMAASNGRTPLVNAVGWCDVKMVTLLLAAGAKKGELATPAGAAGAACKQPADRRAQTLLLLAD